ncbi:Hypothetical protein SRAE_1000104900 [Strongyloides ratti]|uniref:BZIP domain-containing protein n=1 Tax=Strongyloides ratti TaxID=34506 RepID=A0A090KZ45_STRRB|nr:Hypothetical protein SRAE_1000104900 [Strongyloides ratti]CEF62780.1 Hypothetical protein SRAE_1000104900 [Strongyloides ratti]
MSSINKRRYNFVPDTEKNSDSYKKRREANKAAVDKFRSKEKEIRDVQNKIFEEKIHSLEKQVKQYDINRQIDLNIMKNEFTRQIDKLNNSWQSYFDQFVSSVNYQQQQTNAQLVQLVSTVDNLNRIIQNQISGGATGNLYCEGMHFPDEDVFVTSFEDNEFSPTKNSEFGPLSNINNDDQNLPEYPLNDESCVPLNATFTTEGEINFNGPISNGVILPGRPPPAVMEELEDVTSLDELSYVTEGSDTFSFML